MQGVPDRPPLTAWRSVNLRLTAFQSPTVKLMEPNWWTELFGEAAENRIVRPKEGELKEEGPFKDGKLTLRVLPIRIDWVFTVADEAARQAEGFAVMGSFSETVESFASTMGQWLKVCPPVLRVAFGAVLVQPVDDKLTGYQLLSKYLPSVRLDADRSSDFSYSINRPRLSRCGVPDLEINRLSRWSVAMVQGIRLGLTLAPRPVSQSASLGPVFYGCLLDLDINSSPSYERELPPEKVPQVFQELVDFAREIAREGDIP